MGINSELEMLLGQAENLAAETRSLAANVSAAVEDGVRNVRLQADGGGVAEADDAQALDQAIDQAKDAIRKGDAANTVAAMERVADTLFGMGFSHLPQRKPPLGDPNTDPWDGDDRDDRLDEAGDPTTNPW